MGWIFTHRVTGTLDQNWFHYRSTQTTLTKKNESLLSVYLPKLEKEGHLSLVLTVRTEGVVGRMLTLYLVQILLCRYTYNLTSLPFVDPEGCTITTFLSYIVPKSIWIKQDRERE